MKIKNKIVIFILIIINIGVIYSAFLIGKSKAILTNSQISCLAEGVSGKQVIISQEQVLCLAKKREIETICGSGCPLVKPNNSIVISLKSNKKALLENNDIDFEKQLKDLGVYFFKK